MGFNEGINMLILFAIGLCVLAIVICAIYITRDFWAGILPGDLIANAKNTIGWK